MLKITVLADLACHVFASWRLSLVEIDVSLTYSIKDAAQRLGVSKRWLQQFLRKHPTDKDGIPFYVPIGNRKRFTERDLERVLEMNRNAKKDRLVSEDAVVRPNWSQYRANREPGSQPEGVLSERLARALVQLKK